MRRRFESVHNEADFWKLDKRLRGNHRGVPDIMGMNNSVLSDAKSKCDAFSEYFADCFNQVGYNGPVLLFLILFKKFTSKSIWFFTI